MIRFRRAAIAAFGLCAMSLGSPALPEGRTLNLTFFAMSEGAPFQFDAFSYADPVGGEPFQLRDFRFYASGLKLRNGDQEFAQPDSYHLIRFDARSGMDQITVQDVPFDQITEIEISIGLDPEANSSIMPRGDVDPNSRMAWNWAIGYKFILAEGALQKDGETVPLVYHVGFDENLRTLTLPVASLDLDGDIALEVDPLALFEWKNLIDLSELSSVKMNRADATRLADNFGGLLRLAPQ